MRALLDVNVIIALLDPDHVFHDRAHEWWAANAESGWASCPIAENGVVRIMSNPGYSEKIYLTPGELVSKLQIFVRKTDHEFWPDDISLREGKIFTTERIHNSRQLTDFYLLALAAKHGGRLVTFDRGISISSVRIAGAKNLLVI
jgi:hypothetical protein